MHPLETCAIIVAKHPDPRKGAKTQHGNDPKIRLLFDLLIKSCNDHTEGDSFASTQRRGYLMALFSELLPQMKISKLSLGDSDTLRSIVAFCARNYSENLSLSLLQERLHLNKYYISHLFNDKLKIRFNDYINALRINEACRFLANTEASITEISEMVGFTYPCWRGHRIRKGYHDRLSQQRL